MNLEEAKVMKLDSGDAVLLESAQRYEPWNVVESTSRDDQWVVEINTEIADATVAHSIGEPMANRRLYGRPVYSRERMRQMSPPLFPESEE